MVIQQTRHISRKQYQVLSETVNELHYDMVHPHDILKDMEAQKAYIVMDNTIYIKDGNAQEEGLYRWVENTTANITALRTHEEIQPQEIN